MEEERIQQTYSIEWGGLAITITFEPDWLNMGYTSHLQIHAAEKARLPITETGYRSHFIPTGTVEALGGPTDYVLDWLDQAAKSKAWLAHEAQSKQLSLF